MRPASQTIAYAPAPMASSVRRQARGASVGSRVSDARHVLPPVARRFGRRALQRLHVDLLAYLLEDGLRVSGWLRSAKVGRPVTAEGLPLPWYTYGAIHFLEDRLQPGIRVFEFGCGQSTLWFAARTAQVVSVEHDARWHGDISAGAPSNSTLVLRPDPGAYVAEISRHDPSFDVIAVDGLYRADCARQAVARLSGDGVIVWDNSDWDEFEQARDQVAELQAFRELRFTGFGPCSARFRATSILYRSQNCLQI